MSPNRRQVLTTVAGLGAASLAGCLGDLRSGETLSESEPVGTPGENPTPLLTETDIARDGRSIGCESRPTPENGGVPVTDNQYTLVDCPETLVDDIEDGGVGQDGIPSIDSPSFLDAAGGDDIMDEDDPVFGVVRDGETKAYPQHVLVWHEIVNDEIAGDSVAITYCPLTGTAQGFERGAVELGVSGKLLNSNLIMYDRDTESYWPQMLATAISGPRTGATLEEFSVHWTTWGHWKERYPDTQVLSEDTGSARNYDRDPYGSYNPLGGHYADGNLVFPAYVDDPDDRLHPKAVVLGARTATGAFAVEKPALREHGVVTAPVDGEQFAAVYDEQLDTGYVYRNPGERSLEYADGEIESGDESFAPDDLPLDRVVRYDAMWFSWYGYYPHTTLVRRDPEETEA